jgi:hypothetical protein
MSWVDMASELLKNERPRTSHLNIVHKNPWDEIKMAPASPSPYTIKPKSNYEGFKALDRILENVDSGKFKTAKEPIRDIYCPLCHYRKRSAHWVSSELLGARCKEIPFKTRGAHAKGIICCRECAEQVRAAQRDPS